MINMLTGNFPATSGDAIVLGNSIHTDMPEIQRRMGVCPQVRYAYQ
jgi:ATP-binding cassette subfamily A (ABC1) protein 3